MSLKSSRRRRSDRKRKPRWRGRRKKVRKELRARMAKSSLRSSRKKIRKKVSRKSRRRKRKLIKCFRDSSQMRTPLLTSSISKKKVKKRSDLTTCSH